MSNINKVSLNQERYLIAEEYTETNFALAGSYIIKGPLDYDKLIASFQSVIDNNDAFRIKFSKNSNGEISQQVMPNNKVEFDFQTLDNPSEEQIKATISKYFYTKNGIYDVFLTKFQLIKINDTEHILSTSCHHSLFDGLSLAVFMLQLGKAWNQNKTSVSPNTNYLEILSENDLLDISSEKLNALSDYWKKYLLNASPAVIPNDYKLTNINFEEKVSARRFISPEITKEIDSFAKKHELSKFHVFYLAYNILIAKYSEGTDIVTSFESTGRQNLKNASRTIGLFSTALVLRLQFNDQTTIHKLLIDIKNDVEQGIEHQHYPYNYIIKDAKINPKYSFNWFPKVLLPKLDGLEISQEFFLKLQSSFDFNLHCYTQDDGISLEPLYNPTLFSKIRVEIMLEQIENILKQVIANPDQSVLNIKLISENETKFLPNIDLSFAAKIYKKIDEKFYAQVANQPQNIAINYLGQTWTYQEVDQISDKLAQLLQKKGVEAENKVVILGLRCPAMIMAVLAVIRSGASFTILNAAYPAAMLKKYWDTLNPDFLITCDQDSLAAEFYLPNALDSKVVQLGQTLDSNDKLLSPFSYQNTHPQASSQHSIAYHLFTSGTTDEPKCIATSHAPLVHFVNWQIEKFNIVPEDKFTLLSGVSHDPVLRDIFTALSAGATILIPTEETIFNPEMLYNWLVRYKPTVCHTTPAMSKLMYNGYNNKDHLDSLRVIFSGGDRLESHHIEEIATMAPNAAIINFYGASETPQAMAYYPIDTLSLGETIPIGKPVSDTQILVLNHDLKPVGFYEIGQIAVRTKYLSDGYVSTKKTELSKNNKAYLKDVFSDDPEIKIYLTGDNGYFRADGNVVFLGRNDDEIKIRGFRINLNVVNNNIKSIPAIEDAFTFAIEDINSSSDKKRLVAYIVKDSSSTLTINEIRNKLSAKLPSYMLPSQYIFISDLPLLPNGKVDRKKIITAYTENDSNSLTEHIAGRNEIENNIIYAWSKILNINPKKISAKDSFTTLDGDSLSFIQASVVLEKEIGKLPEDWQSLSIEKIAEINYQKQNRIDIHTEVLFRAIAITLVVIGHFWIVDVSHQIELLFINATSALFLIAGYTFANFPMKSIQYKNDITPILKSIIRIAAPTFLVTLAHVIYRSDYSISKLLFFDNFHWDRSPYWFIELLLQTLLLLSIIFSFKKIRQYAMKAPYNFGLILLCICSLAGILIPYFWNPEGLNPLQLPHMKSWLFFLGWCIFYIEDNKQKLTVALLGLILPILVLGQVSLLTSVCTILLIYVPKMHIPKTKLTNLLHIIIYAIASASLYIYITHIQIKSVLHAIGLDQYVLLDILAGISGGIVLHYIWHSVLASIARKVVANLKIKLKLISKSLINMMATLK
jgi:amino acid adenylation domain-containing protein